MSLLFTILFFALLSATRANDRIRSKFDFGWKFNLGVDGLYGSCDDSVFPVSTDGKQCLGLTLQNSIHNAGDCQQLCCDNINCQTYGWCEQTANRQNCSPPGTCWTGLMNDCEVTSQTGWVGRGRTNTPVMEPPAQIKFDDSHFVDVNVPQDYVVEGTFSPQNEQSHGYLPKNVSWYRKHFSLPNGYKNSSLWIDFDGIYRDSDMWLNDVFLGNHASGYTSFRYFLNDSIPLQYGDNSDNVLAVFVDPTQDEGWWYEGGGIYRHTWFTRANKVHFEPWGIYLPSNVTNIYSNGVRGDGNFIVNFTVFNDRSTTANNLRAQFTVIGPDSEVLTILNSAAFSVHSMANTNIAITQSVQDIQLWDVTQAALYTVYASIIENGDVIDSVEERFGFRRAVFDVNHGFLLNGRNIKMTGFCNHQDFAGTGTAMLDRMNQYRVRHLQNMGGNAWRMSHNPPNPELLDFTDEYGFLVWDENRNLANNSQYLRDQRDMILRDRNHPSIVIWSICNEAGCMEGQPESGPVAQMFKDVVRAYDAQMDRPVAAAMNGGWGDAMTNVLDLQGINYSYEEFSKFHKQYPNKPLISSESCSCTTDRETYVNNATGGYCSAYTSCPWNNDPCPQGCWQPIVNTEYVGGSFDWTGFDYKGEPTPYSWPDVNSHFGVNDLAGFPKDNYWYYKAWWLPNEPLLHLLPHWNWVGSEYAQRHKLQVRAYSNCEFVELFLNNVSISNGAEQMQRYDILSWEVTYAPGVLSANCLDANKQVVSTTAVHTTGDAYAIRMEVEFAAEGTAIYGDGQDVAMIAVHVVDSNERVVPTAGNFIQFAVTEGPGAILGVGNGDPACHEPDKASSRSAWRGRARVLVQSSQINSSGYIRLTAQSPGLIGTEVRINVVYPRRQQTYV